MPSRRHLVFGASGVVAATFLCAVLWGGSLGDPPQEIIYRTDQVGTDGRTADVGVGGAAGKELSSREAPPNDIQPTTPAAPAAAVAPLATGASSHARASSPAPVAAEGGGEDTAAVATATARRSDASLAGAGAVDEKCMLAYQGPGAEGSCEAASPELHALRCRGWPKKFRAPAPRISRVLYISLRKSMRRDEWMREQLKRFPAGVSWERVEGVDRKTARTDPRFKEIRDRGFNQVEYPVAEGQWDVAGCMFSHLTALRKLREIAAELLARREVWLILEDDATITPQILQDWEQRWPYVPQQWDILRLGWLGDPSCAAAVNDLVDAALWENPPPWGPCRYCGSHAYVVNPASADHVVQRLERSRMMHMDCLLGAPPPPLEDPRQVPPLKSFVFRQSLVEQNEKLMADRRDGA